MRQITNVIKHDIKQAGVAVTVLTYIRKVTGSNLVRGTIYFGITRGFPQSVYENDGTVHQLVHESFCLCSSPFIINLSYYAIESQYE
jgi:hypothetical protein